MALLFIDKSFRRKLSTNKIRREDNYRDISTANNFNHSAVPGWLKFIFLLGIVLVLIGLLYFWCTSFYEIIGNIH